MRGRTLRHHGHLLKHVVVQLELVFLVSQRPRRFREQSHRSQRYVFRRGFERKRVRRQRVDLRIDGGPLYTSSSQRD